MHNEMLVQVKYGGTLVRLDLHSVGRKQVVQWVKDKTHAPDKRTPAAVDCVYEGFWLTYSTEDAFVAWYDRFSTTPPEPKMVRSFTINLGLFWLGGLLEILQRPD